MHQPTGPQYPYGYGQPPQGYGPAPGQGYGPPPHAQHAYPQQPYPYPVAQPVIYVQQTAQYIKPPFNHGVHLLVDFFTCGAWLPIHLILWAAH